MQSVAVAAESAMLASVTVSSPVSVGGNRSRLTRGSWVAVNSGPGTAWRGEKGTVTTDLGQDVRVRVAGMVYTVPKSFVLEVAQPDGASSTVPRPVPRLNVYAAHCQYSPVLPYALRYHVLPPFWVWDTYRACSWVTPMG